jgi:tetratricopeptide (TPR) repeat protein
MIKFTHLFLIALLFCGIAAPPIASAQSAPINPIEQAVKDAETIKQLERDKAEARYQKDIAEIKAEVLENRTDWYAIIATLFGVLITAVVIYFTFRFNIDARQKMDATLKASKMQSDQAIADAKIQLDAVLKQAAADAKIQSDAVLEQAEAMLQQVKSIIAEIKTHNETAKSLLAEIPVGTAPTDPKTIKSVAELAKQASKKPMRERTAEDYRALVINALIDKDWAEMERHASAMVYLLAEEADQETIAFAMFKKAYALGKLFKHNDAIAAYDALIERFGSNDRPEIQEDVATAFNNKGSVLGKFGNHNDAIAAFEAVIERYSSSDRPEIQEPVAMALFNKGVALSKLGKHDDAIAANEAVIERFGSSDRPEVAKALFNKACALAQLGNVQACVDSLETWVEKRGDIECDDIQKDTDFDTVRDDPVFLAFMAKHGCGAT